MIRLGTNASDHYAILFPYQRSIGIRRDLKHFDCWLRYVFEETIDVRVDISYIYKVFFLSHVSLLPSAVKGDHFLPYDLTQNLQLLGLLGTETLSCRQAATRVLSVLRWQHFEFNIDTRELLGELIPFFRQVSKMIRSQEFTYKSSPQPETVLKVYRCYPIPGPQPERDQLILLMTWLLGCSPNELARLSFADFQVLSPLDWMYLRRSSEGGPVKLDHMTALGVCGVMTENQGLGCKDVNRLLKGLKGRAWRRLTERDIEVIIERHYRFAEALWGFDPKHNHFGFPAPDLSLEEEGAYTAALKRIGDQIIANRRQLLPAVGKEESGDWDAAINKQMARRRSVERETGDSSEDDQVDWDAAINKSK